MSKSNQQVLILPGESGWEIWARNAEGSFEPQHATDLMHAGDLQNIPAGQLMMLFAVKSFTAVPLRVMTTEEAMFDDLVALHAERLGLRTDPLAGQLSDRFVIEREEESAVLLAAFLKPPGERELPQRSPGSFDLSARVMPVEGNAVVVWRELGRWVFAVHQGGHLLYAQATACENTDAAFARELKLALMQLGVQGLELKPTRIEVWSADPACDLSAIRDAFELPVELHERPHPVLPKTMSKLLPEDVRAARRVAQRRQRIQLVVAAVVLFYLGLVGWLAYGLWQDTRTTQWLVNQADEATPELEGYAQHADQWRELADAIELSHSPVEVLHRISGCIPPQGGLRLSNVEIDAYNVIIKGQAPGLDAVNRFNLKLTKHPGLVRYTWQTRNPDKKVSGYHFDYNGYVPQSAP